jgi:hypothetical protein
MKIAIEAYQRRSAEAQGNIESVHGTMIVAEPVDRTS